MVWPKWGRWFASTRTSFSSHYEDDWARCEDESQVPCGAHLRYVRDSRVYGVRMYDVSLSVSPSLLGFWL